MKKVLFVVGTALGHVGRCLVIVNELVATEQVQIHFACASPGWGEKVIPEEIPFFKLPFNEWGDTLFADGLESVIDQLKPDLICLDMTPLPWLYHVRFPEIPQVYITNFFLTQLGPMETGQDNWFSNNKACWNDIRVARGLEPLANARDLYERDAVLLCDPPFLVHSKSPTPPHNHIVGPCTWGSKQELPVELNTLDNVLFISFGSSGERALPIPMVEEIAEALEIQTVVWLSSKHQHNSDQFGRIKHLAYSWLPSSRVLSKSKFVITQGGTGSSYQAMALGIPIGVWPTHRNHELLGIILQDYGCGMLMKNSSSTNAEYLQQNIELMRARSNGARESLAMVNGPENAANVIIKMLSNS